ncbi:MAG: carbon-nitrogen hydrolase family protein [Moraxellaceae bacterium]|jgi:predicted amidohydrolase|nr:carbon-nitrogen hydrolase family protein [Moraxellaceae bacterium]
MSVTVAAIQMNSLDNLQDNLQQAEALLIQAANSGAKLAVLPENFAVFAAGRQIHTAQQMSMIQAWLAEQSIKNKLWLVAGSIPCLYRPDGQSVLQDKVRACCLVYNPQGELAGRYDKIHLFDALLADQQAQYQESATFEAGDEIVVINTPFANIGLSICYDIRFPALYQALRDKGADIIVVPAAFTALTGAAHWQVLLRARAIENQCMMIGAGQSGWHSASRQTWGHSQIIDAWGKVLAEQEQGVGVVLAQYVKAELQQVRQQMPVLRHRRLCVTQGLS